MMKEEDSGDREAGAEKGGGRTEEMTGEAVGEMIWEACVGMIGEATEEMIGEATEEMIGEATEEMIGEPIIEMKEEAAEEMTEEAVAEMKIEGKKGVLDLAISEAVGRESLTKAGIIAEDMDLEIRNLLQGPGMETGKGDLKKEGGEEKLKIQKAVFRYGFVKIVFCSSRQDET